MNAPGSVIPSLVTPATQPFCLGSYATLPSCSILRSHTAGFGAGHSNGKEAPPACNFFAPPPASFSEIHGGMKYLSVASNGEGPSPFVWLNVLHRFSMLPFRSSPFTPRTELLRVRRGTENFPGDFSCSSEDQFGWPRRSSTLFLSLNVLFLLPTSFLPRPFSLSPQHDSTKLAPFFSLPLFAYVPCAFPCALERVRLF